MLLERKLRILTYHRVLTAKDSLRPAQTDVEMFEIHVRALAKYFNVLRLDDAVSRLNSGTLPPRAVAITFDDGYRDNATVALPILGKYNLTATFFIATGFLDGGRMWNDSIIEAIRNCSHQNLDLRELNLGNWEISTEANRRHAISALIGKLKYLEISTRLSAVDNVVAAAEVDLPNDLMMTSAQVRQLVDNGMLVGAHTVNHPILSQIDLASARDEIARCKTVLEDITERSINTFAYPNGKPSSDYLRPHVDIVGDLGFDIAVTTASGCATRETDVLQLPRIVSWDRTSTRFNIRMLRAGFGPNAAQLN